MLLLYFKPVSSVEHQITIKIGVNSDNDPVAFLEKGEMKGIFVDLIIHIEKFYDWNIELIPDSWPNLITKFNNNEIDMIGGIAYDDLRAKIYSFSNETVFNNWAMIWTTDPNINGILDLEGKNIAIVSNSIHYTGIGGLLNVLRKFNVNCTFSETSTDIDVIKMLDNNTVDVGVINRFSAKKYTPEFNLIDTNIIFNPIELRYAIKKDHPENLYLLEDIDSLIRSMKTDSSSEYFKIIDKYFGIVTPDFDINQYFKIGIEIIIILIPVIFIIIFINSRYLIRKKTKELLKTNEELRNAKKHIEKENQAKSEFFANISHEVRSPLHLISGYVSLVEETDLSKKQAQYIKIISHANDNLSRIVLDILTLSQIEKNTFSIQKQKFKLDKALEFFLTPLQDLAKQKGIKLNKIIDESLLITYFDDQLRLGQILTNLIENAIKYTNSGSVTCKMKFISSTNSKISLMIKIIDTGIGISADLHEKVFDPFFKLEKDPNITIKGVGLGLTIVKKLLNSFNGRLNLKSELNQGTTIELFLELEKYSHQNKKYAEFEKEVDGQFAFKEILIVDDIEDNLNLMELFINKFRSNNKIFKSINGKNAINIFEINKIDIVFLDIRMHDMDGIEVLKIIRTIEKRKNLTHCKVIAVTAYINDSEREEYYKMGFDSILDKPIDRKELQLILLED